MKGGQPDLSEPLAKSGQDHFTRCGGFPKTKNRPGSFARRAELGWNYNFLEHCFQIGKLRLLSLKADNTFIL